MKKKIKARDVCKLSEGWASRKLPHSSRPTNIAPAREAAMPGKKNGNTSGKSSYYRKSKICFDQNFSDSTKFSSLICWTLFTLKSPNAEHFWLNGNEFEICPVISNEKKTLHILNYIHPKLLCTLLRVVPKKYSSIVCSFTTFS